MINFIKAFAQNLYAFGFDIRKFKGIFFVPRFVLDLIHYIRQGGSANEIYANVSDYHDNAGSAKGHYFHQDLLVATKIFRAKPDEHLDIGSRVDGFVAHVATFMRITVADVRPLDVSGHENLTFRQMDLMGEKGLKQYSSVSCLHALEHFGLGRYGDPLDPAGSEKGLTNICDLVKPGGCLYLSFPISHRPRTVFNAHRVFSPDYIFGHCSIKSDFILEDFSYVDDLGDMHGFDRSIDDIAKLEMDFGCGIYTLKKRVELKIGEFIE